MSNRLQTQGGSDEPNRDFAHVRLPWARASAQSLCGGDFDVTSAVGYFFARDLHLALGVATMPVGLIVSSVPGTAIEMWSPPEALARCNVTKVPNSPTSVTTVQTLVS